MTSSSKLERTRYILLYYEYERPLREDELRKTFSNHLNRLYGIKGSLEMGLFLSWTHEHEPLAILRSSHDNIAKLLCVTFFITELNEKNLTIIPLKTGGSIKKMKSLALSTNWKDLINFN